MVESAAGCVLVTGAAGLLGRSFVNRARQANVPVISVVRKARRAAANEIIHDLTDLRTPLLAAVKVQPTAVVHLAACAPPRHADNAENARLTELMDRQVADATRAWGARFIYASTCGLYDPIDAAWKDEAAGVDVRTPYFAAKASGEAAALAISGIVLRISSPFGPGMMPSLVLPRFINAAWNGGTIEVWGSGAREQDFISVRDVSDAIFAAMHGGKSGVFNVAKSVPITMADLAALVVDTLARGKVVKGSHADPLEGCTARFNSAKAQREWGWAPKHDLREALPALVKAMRQ